MKKILGISAYYHDSAAAIVIGTEIIAAAQEERFTRIKHTPDFPTNAIKFCLEESGLDIEDLDAIVFYDKPLLKFERLLSTYYAFAPKGIISFIKSMSVWASDKLFLKKKIYDELKKIGSYNSKLTPLLFTEHHLAHAASAFYPSSFEESAILTIDGVGEWCTASIGIGVGSEISIISEMSFPHSVGLLYSAFTYYLGFKVNSGEYKLMGLAPFGNILDAETIKYTQLIKSKLVDIKVDGSIWLNQFYFDYATGLKMAKDSKWFELFGISKRSPADEITQQHCNLALAIQTVIEEVVVLMAQETKRITGQKNICLAGGVALNCVANSKILEKLIFENIYIQPASGDAGCALGAALATAYMYYDETRVVNVNNDSMKGTYLGPSFSDKEIQKMCRINNANVKKYESFEELCKIVANKISDGKVVGWFQGRMEFGPRALGNRSILADPRNPEMQKKLNLMVKFREGFRPFAPAILTNHKGTFFDLKIDSPYMLFVAQIADKIKFEIIDNVDKLSIFEKLYSPRSSIQSVTHVDYSARVQTVDEKINKPFWTLLNAFYLQTDCPILINTSFNVRGEPIVLNPSDAYSCFMRTDIDILIINNYFLSKELQPDFQNRDKWQVLLNED